MSILKVARMGHPVLRAVAKPLDRGELKSVAIQRLIDDLVDTMIEYHGVGLAAPQVHESVRIFVAAVDPNGGDTPPDEPMVMVNPEITPIGEDVIEDWEGCLSIPDIRGRVPRARQIRVKALNRKGEKIEGTWSEFQARVIQHETDHLHGVLFFDRMTTFDSLTFLDEYQRYWTRDED